MLTLRKGFRFQVVFNEKM